ncbi:MAG TPA: aminotransferase class IV, partial [Gaiellaceae bacterium]|nr:aminotransferase class IV [Gaiellaceae bacterium]
MDVCAVAVAGRGLIEPHEPVFAADDEALLRGRSVFETAHVYGGRPFLLDRHLARFAVSAERLRLPPPDATECERLAELVVDACEAEDLALRLYWTGRTLVATAAPIDPELEALRGRGLRLVTVPWSTGELASAKSMSYAENMGAQDTAVAAGADDALLVADDGTVLEAPTANVWWREGDTLLTPSLDLPILAGVTRGILLELAERKTI